MVGISRGNKPSASGRSFTSYKAPKPEPLVNGRIFSSRRLDNFQPLIEGVNPIVRRRVNTLYGSQELQKSSVKEYLKDILDKMAPRKPYRGYADAFLIAISTLSIISSAFFLSSNVTGMAIGNTNILDSNIMGILLFVLGLMGIVLFARRR